MKRYKYIKSNAFTAGASLGNPAACVFTGEESLSPDQMQAVAREHKGFVMEVVFCSHSCVPLVASDQRSSADVADPDGNLIEIGSLTIEQNNH